MIIVSAGDALTARLIKEAGFDGIWVSGFEVSARLGLQDNGSITMTEMLNATKPIVEATDLPVFVDVDTGYGNFERTVREFEKIGVYALSVEDNMPKKENSLWGGQVPLMSIPEFSDKLKSAKNRKIKVIARTEALIRGYEFNEAVRRAKAYEQAGADILLVHTRDTTGLEATKIPTECRDIKIPLAIVPTKFSHITNNMLVNMGYSYVIWANQTERIKIKAIREGLQSLKKYDCALHIEKKLSATLDDMKGLCS